MRTSYTERTYHETEEGEEEEPAAGSKSKLILLVFCYSFCWSSHVSFRASFPSI